MPNTIGLESSLLVRALRGEATERAPLWLMRQAGRYLPEYREVRAKHSMLDVIRTPELAAKVTLQPIDRFGFDGAIIFADILNPLIGMGIQLDFVEGEGPVIFNPVQTPSDVDQLKVPSPKENVPYTLEALRLVVKELSPRGVPTLGFSGAPFTLATYLLSKKGDKELAKRFMRDNQSAWAALQKKLTTLVSDYLVAQAEAGASAVQIFDSWVGVLSPSEFATFVLPWLQQVVASVKSRTKVPVIYFATSAGGLLAQFPSIGADVYGIDWRLTFAAARQTFGNKPLQGNLDPTILLGDKSYLEKETRRILAEGKEGGPFIFNLGHGILPPTPIANVETLVSLVKTFCLG